MAVELYDEHEQSERVRKWVREYAFAVGMGVVLAFAGIFGWRQWQEYQAGQGALAAEYYASVRNELAAGRLDTAEAQYMAMVDTVERKTYTSLAGMLLAREWAEEGRLDEAEAVYRRILELRRLRPLHPVATMRLARVLDQQGETGAALGLLSGESPPGYAAAWAELRGDFLLALGRPEHARQAYLEALEAASTDGADSRLLQLKMDATGPGSSGGAS